MNKVENLPDYGNLFPFFVECISKYLPNIIGQNLPDKNLMKRSEEGSFSFRCGRKTPEYPIHRGGTGVLEVEGKERYHQANPTAFVSN